MNNDNKIIKKVPDDRNARAPGIVGFLLFFFGFSIGVLALVLGDWSAFHACLTAGVIPGLAFCFYAQAIKNQKKCENCGNSVNRSSKICPTCRSCFS